ncbi:MAG: maltose alpha-D-glucosyltransferase [Candidatus Eremiobacteraeota bacterium]|nr:maltose alpha-D-glucosyltransferase [Candidatus Eremiobacteraeota bacterium]
MEERWQEHYREQTEREEYIRWLELNSMLYQAEILARSYLRTEKKWQRPYALPNPRAVVSKAPAWFTAYPASMITAKGESILRTLADDRLWDCLREIGIKALHTGPTKRAGGLSGRHYTPSIDGSFDRISYDVAPDFGSDIDYLEMVHVAKNHGAIIIGDVIPGHTGKGADFLLAERNFSDYPGIYHMVMIGPEDWNLLPPVPAGADSANLSQEQVQKLKEKGYIIGELTRIIFYEPGIKESNWSATAVVTGQGGEKFRWVYLHYFKEGQPTLNWLDPSFAAQRLLIGDIIDSMRVLGDSGLRLDANGFLGIEVNPMTGKAWSEGHPLSVTANGIIAMMVRKLGGFTFQELNLTLEDLKAMTITGPDLSYDFITRPAYHHALAAGNVEFLRLMMRLMHQYQIDPAALVHALQNHDELTLELIHFNTAHAEELFRYRGKKLRGADLRAAVHREMFSRYAGGGISYNVAHPNGIVSTNATLCAAVLGIRDVYRTTPSECEGIKRLHLLLAMFNAFQPGVFALSGWDLVGALTLRPEEAAELLADGDTRWLNRGAYDLMEVNPHATHSGAGIARAVSLYGSLPQQLKSPDSFLRKLQHMLAVREEYRIPESKQTAIPPTRSRGLIAMVHELPSNRGILVTVLNFSSRSVEDTIRLKENSHFTVTDILERKTIGSTRGQLCLSLAPFEGKALLLD